MLVDQSAPRRAILEKILRESGYVNVFATAGLCDVFSLVDDVAPDVVLIELESPNRDTLEQLRAIREQRPTPVVMFAQDQDAQTVHAAVESGVCAYMVDSVDLNTVKPAIALAMATFNAYRRVRAEADGYRKELANQKRLDLAKSAIDGAQVAVRSRGLSNDAKNGNGRKREVKCDRSKHHQSLSRLDCRHAYQAEINHVAGAAIHSTNSDRENPHGGRRLEFTRCRPGITCLFRRHGVA